MYCQNTFYEVHSKYAELETFETFEVFKTNGSYILNTSIIPELLPRLIIKTVYIL